MKKPLPASKAPDESVPEPRNIAVTVLANRTQIRNAICAAGKCDFALTLTEAQTLEALGKVSIDGTAA